MRLSLYLKFILAYIIFGVAGFVAIATISSQLTYSYLVESRSQTLYDEANLIASTYSTVYEGQNISLEESYPHLSECQDMGNEQKRQDNSGCRE